MSGKLKIFTCRLTSTCIVSRCCFFYIMWYCASFFDIVQAFLILLTLKWDKVQLSMMISNLATSESRKTYQRLSESEGLRGTDVLDKSVKREELILSITVMKNKEAVDWQKGLCDVNICLWRCVLSYILPCWIIWGSNLDISQHKFNFNFDPNIKI